VFLATIKCQNLHSRIKMECSGKSQLSTHHKGICKCPRVVTTHSATLAAVEDLHMTCCVTVFTYQTNCALCGDGGRSVGGSVMCEEWEGVGRE